MLQDSMNVLLSKTLRNCNSLFRKSYSTFRSSVIAYAMVFTLSNPGGVKTPAKTPVISNMVDGSGNIQVIAEFPPPFLKSDNIVYYSKICLKSDRPVSPGVLRFSRFLRFLRFLRWKSCKNPEFRDGLNCSPDEVLPDLFLKA